MIKYSDGREFKQTEFKKQKAHKHIISSGNRGMRLESDINLSNDFYLQSRVCLITKRPTPINVVKVDYSKGAKITDAYFEKQSTTDYNGIYKGKYIDFEAKSTVSTTSFPMANISPHQITHLKNVIYFGGIAFFIIEFASFNEIYLLDAKYVIDFYEQEGRKSIPYKTLKEKGTLIKQGYLPRLQYIDAINENYFN
mgnify:CR=1 FL=1